MVERLRANTISGTVLVSAIGDVSVRALSVGGSHVTADQLVISSRDGSIGSSVGLSGMIYLNADVNSLVGSADTGLAIRATGDLEITAQPPLGHDMVSAGGLIGRSMSAGYLGLSTSSGDLYLDVLGALTVASSSANGDGFGIHSARDLTVTISGDLSLGAGIGAADRLTVNVGGSVTAAGGPGLEAIIKIAKGTTELPAADDMTWTMMAGQDLTLDVDGAVPGLSVAADTLTVSVDQGDLALAVSGFFDYGGDVELTSVVASDGDVAVMARGSVLIVDVRAKNLGEVGIVSVDGDATISSQSSVASVGTVALAGLAVRAADTVRGTSGISTASARTVYYGGPASPSVGRRRNRLAQPGRLGLRGDGQLRQRRSHRGRRGPQRGRCGCHRAGASSELTLLL